MILRIEGGNAMSQIEINSDKCNSCGTCIAICTKECISGKEEGSTPVIDHPESCIVCGHCIAACPADAMNHPEMSKAEFSRVYTDGIDPKTLARFLASKRSVRKYSDQPVEQEIIEKILKAGSCAPQAKNSRTQNFHLITDPDKIEEMEQAVVNAYRKVIKLASPPIRPLIGCILPHKGRLLKNVRPSLERLVQKADNGGKPIFHSAPVVIAIDGLKSNLLAKDDASIAMQYMMMLAYAEGIDSCLIGYASSRPASLRKILNVPKDREVQVVAIFGHGSMKYKTSIWREMVKTARLS